MDSSLKEFISGNRVHLIAGPSNPVHANRSSIQFTYVLHGCRNWRWINSGAPVSSVPASAVDEFDSDRKTRCFNALIAVAPPPRRSRTSRAFWQLCHGVLGMSNEAKFRRPKDVCVNAVWMYWEDQLDGGGIKKTKPAYYDLFQATVLRHNPNARTIDKAEASELLDGLPAELDTVYVAHRSDWIRKMILWRYGGLYVDSDFVCFEPLGSVLGLAATFDFVGYREWNEYVGYRLEANPSAVLSMSTAAVAAAASRPRKTKPARSGSGILAYVVSFSAPPLPARWNDPWRKLTHRLIPGYPRRLHHQTPL